MDAYLKRFERYEESLKWPQEEWAVNLSALLRGKALEVYSRLSREAAGNYEALKEALLRRFQLTQEGFRQKFRACQPETGESAPQFAIHLDNYLMRWIELSKSEKSGEGESIQSACACYSNESWAHECCTHGDKVRLECGHELPLVSALCRNKEKMKSMPVVSGILNGKEVSVLRDSGCSTAVVRKDLVLDCQMTGKIQRCILIDGTVKDAPVARIWVSSPYYTGNVDALCMSEPVFDLILGNIPCVREPNEPEKDWHSSTERGKIITENGSGDSKVTKHSLEREAGI